MKKHLLFFLALMPVFSVAQSDLEISPCGIHDAERKLFEKHPEYEAIHEADQAEFESFCDEFHDSYSYGERALYVIPVVVHVIHQGGPENISDEQIYDAIKQLNEDFSQTNEDFSGAVAPFNTITGDMDIEFRLAGKDINGNCVKGITRTVSELTYGGDDGSISGLVESVHGSWPQNRYMNIFVQAVLGVEGAAGYTYTPGSWYPADGMDGGIYMLASYMGAIGTSNETREHTLSHEAGHWLNLKHPWGGSNSPGDEANCGTDDGVADTPNTIGWTYCNLSGESCGSLDNVQNIMDYSYCTCMFTQGQVERVHAALASSTAQRNNLSTAANHEATGVNGILCAADFVSDKSIVCSGSTVEFTDVSYHQITSRLWTFEGGTPSTSTDEMPVVTYDTPGKYDVTLQVWNGAEEESLTLTDYISVFNSTGVSLPYHEGFEDMTGITDDNRFAFINENDEETWDINTDYAHFSTKSAWLSNYGNDDQSKDHLISQTIDLSTVDSTESMIFTFDYSYTKRHSGDQEQLRVYISGDCGETWKLRLVLDSDEMTETTAFGPYYPLYDGWWKKEYITTITPPYYLSNFMYKFEFRNDNGNNIFLDNINIYPAAMADIIENGVAVSVYPNPANNQLFVSGFSEGDYQITNQIGQLVQLGSFGNNENIDISNLSSGLYQIQISALNGASSSVQRFIKR